MMRRCFAFVFALGIVPGTVSDAALAASKSLVAAAREGVPAIEASVLQPVVVKEAGRAQTTYTDRAAFRAASSGGTVVEGYENGNVPAGGVSSCLSPMNVNTNDPPCVNAGDIQFGIEMASVNSPGAGGLAMLGAGFAGNPSRTVVANYFTDSENINLDAATRGCAWGADLQAYFSGVPLTVSVFDPALVLTGSYTAPSSNTGTFFGVIDDTSDIARVNLFDATGANAEGGDDQEWGGAVTCPFPVDLQSVVVE